MLSDILYFFQLFLLRVLIGIIKHIAGEACGVYRMPGI